MKMLLVLLFLSSNVFAQKKLSRETFQVNIRPVLSAILNDFYQMVENFPEYPKDLNLLIGRMDALAEAKENLKTLCPRYLTAKCLPQIEEIRIHLSDADTKTFHLLRTLGISPSLHLSTISGFRTLSEFHQELSETRGRLSNTSLLLRAQLQDKNLTFDVIRNLDRLSTLLSLTVVEFIPYGYRDEFRHFYFNFMQPVSLQISKNQNYEFLNRNIQSLNFSLNLLNMNLTKRNKKTPDGMGPYLGTIHNRWNSILRYYY